MAATSRKTPKRKSRSKLVKAVTDHPVAAVGIAGAAVLGAVLAKKAVNTAGKVMTINAAAKGAATVARAARKPARKGARGSKAKAKK